MSRSHRKKTAVYYYLFYWLFSMIFKNPVNSFKPSTLEDPFYNKVPVFNIIQRFKRDNPKSLNFILFGDLGQFFFYPVFKTLRSLNFDQVIVIGGHLSLSAMIAWFSGGAYRLGVCSKKGQLFDLVYDEHFHLGNNLPEHQVYSTSGIFQIAGFSLPKTLPSGLKCLAQILLRKASWPYALTSPVPPIAIHWDVINAY